MSVTGAVQSKCNGYGNKSGYGAVLLMMTNRDPYAPACPLQMIVCFADTLIRDNRPINLTPSESCTFY